MPDVVYFIWALLPLAQIVIAVRASVKKALKVGTQEEPKNYWRSVAFSLFALALAICLDKLLYESIAELMESFELDARILRWLLYPAVLALLAVVQQIFIDKRNKEEEADKTARRLKYAKKKEF
jgi:hypothetical protein